MMIAENGYPRLHTLNISKDPLDDDGRPKRTGTMWTASAHIITAVIGSGVLSLAWAMAQLGWIAGPVVMILFSFVTYYTSTLLASCYRTGDPVTGKRNYTYMDAVKSSLGTLQGKLCGYVQQINLFGAAVGYTITTGVSMMAISHTNCIHRSGGSAAACSTDATPFIIAFGIIELVLSQIKGFGQLWWLSTVAATMSFTYSIIGLGLEIAKVAATRKVRGNLTGIRIGAAVTPIQKIRRVFQALGNIAFAYSYSIILIEIQDTIKSPPSEVETMKVANRFSVAVTTLFYMLCACFGYAAFGDSSPGNLLTATGLNPYWLLDVANVAVVLHLVGAYQVFSQPIFAFVEDQAARRFPDSRFVNKEIKIRLPGSGDKDTAGNRYYGLNMFRLVWRTGFVVVSTTISILVPFFNDIVGLLGAIGFWPLTVYFPIEMYIAGRKIVRWSGKWVLLKLLSMGCLMITVAAAAGSIAGIVDDLKASKGL
ncbi:unnamed protein product [Linum tenue]|uniref:Amino acid transporter transmembrane domain-containing protein n=1 Tax=Linum tenue TaxID=586396 RepID=A0AAV0I780_9ROSI|nr:unnamed protein product [Linum tenue]